MIYGQSHQTPAHLIKTEKAIVSQHTGVPVDEIILNNNGWTSRVYLIDGGRLVFKFPRTAIAREHYVHEIAALQLCAGLKSPVKTPTVQWVADDYVYLGMQGIIGLNVDTHPHLSEADRIRIGTELGMFLQLLHKQDPEGYPSSTLEDEITIATDKYLSGREILFTHLSTDEQQQVERFMMELFPAVLRNYNQDSVLSHGDLGMWNALYDRERGVGVIDFGDVGVYDRCRDFVGMVDDTILDAALGVYGRFADQAFRAQIALRQLRMPIVDLPYFIETGDQAGIERMLTLLRSYLPHYL